LETRDVKILPFFYYIEHPKYDEKQNTKFSFDQEYLPLLLNAASLPQEYPYL